MKTFPCSILLTIITATAMAQQPQPDPSKRAFVAPAVLAEKDPGLPVKRIWLLAATKTEVRYQEVLESIDSFDRRLSELGALYVYEPKEYTEAMDLYQNRKYAEAKAKFQTVKERFKPLALMENSHAAMAAFYELECLRRTGDLDGLAATLRNFVKNSLTRETQLTQIELYVLWDAVRTRSWPRLEILAKERATTPLPGDQRAQVAYCHGLALEGLKRPAEALFAYNTAMIADSGASEEIAREAALRILTIQKADEDVRQAIKVWGTKDENKSSPGYANLTEAAAVAELFELSLGGGAPLPGYFKMFLKYRDKTPTAPIAGPSVSIKPEKSDKPGEPGASGENAGSGEEEEEEDDAGSDDRSSEDDAGGE